MRDLGDFQGEWRLTRCVTERRAARVARFSGRARLVPDGAGLRYEEWGRWTDAPWGPLEGSRTYLWRPGEGGRIAVLFADGRPFHHFAPGGGAGSDHPCGPDLYRVTYAFGDWPFWSAEWDVTGPRKDHALRTDYAPVGVVGAGARAGS